MLLNELGSLWLTEKKPAEARPLFERAVAVEGRNPRARLGLAESLGEAGDLEGALASLDEARTLDIHHPALEVYRATVLSRLGRPGEAVVVLETVLQSNPDAHEARKLLGLIAYSLNRDSLAADALAGALATNPADAEARIVLGKILFRRADYDGARAAFERVLEDDERNQEAHFYLGEIARASVRFEEAALHYGKVGSAGARRGQAEALLRLGRYDEAETALAEALALDTAPRARAESLYLLGTLRNERGNPAAAVEALSEAAKNDPHHTRTRYVLGTILVRLGRVDEGREELAAFQALEAFENRKEKLELAMLARPDDASSYVPLIELYLEHGRGEEALPFLEKALALAPGDPALRDLSARLPRGKPRC